MKYSPLKRPNVDLWSLPSMVAGLTVAALMATLVVTDEAHAEVLPPDADQSFALFSMANDTISVLMNDARFPLDDFDLPNGTTHINNLYIGLYDGSTGYYFNDFVQGGNSSLILIGDVVEGGTAPNQTVTMTFADADPPTRFRIELVVEMLGNGAHGIRCTAVVTNLLMDQSLENAKFFVFSDVLVAAGDSNDVTAFDGDSGIFYAYDDTSSPNTWFGVHGNDNYPMHYEGRAYQGPVGLAPFHAALVAGNNLTDIVESTPQDQVAGWNWDLGSIDDTATVGFAIAAHTSLPSLIEALEVSLPEPAAPIFADGFESGDTLAWD